jgi:hypothetical protein
MIFYFFYTKWSIEVQGKHFIAERAMVAHPNKRGRQVL